MSFAFEKLDVYQKALDLVQSVDELISDLKGKAPHSTIDQLSRAAYSIPLNIAEGSGRWHKPEKRQFFRIAQGSVCEVVPIMQVLMRRKLIEQPAYDDFYSRLENISKMLTMLIRAVEQMDR